VRLRRNPGVNRGWSVSAPERNPEFVALGHRFARLGENKPSSVSNEILSADDCCDSAHAGSPVKPRNATGRASADSVDDILQRAKTLKRVRSASRLAD